MEKVGMETIPIHSEDESDELDSVKAMETEYWRPLPSFVSTMKWNIFL